MPQLPPPSQQDCAYFDFIEGLKIYNYTRNVKGLLENYKEKASEFQEKKGYLPSTMEEAGRLLEPDLLYQFACATQHVAQHMMWSAGCVLLKERYEENLAMMKHPTGAGG